ncbi:MAG TPA: enoyl-CoA hydratase/isomerase family protein [Mycobacteriales bacterium]|nr:enoyl-CoA hydratase/isomerase family protein [Mycobacteriales bacterium]
MIAANALEVADGDGVRHLRLNRPEKLNALNAEIRDQLWAELNRLAEDPAVRVVVLSGTGRAFSAGVDLAAAVSERQVGGWTEQRHVAGKWQRILDLLEAIPQVTVATLQGHCIGGAALIAAACDLRVGADNLQVRIPELELNIPLTWGGLPRLQREIGLPLTRDLVMSARVLAAEEALRAGFIQRLVPADRLQEATEQLTGDLLAMPAGPLAMTRAALSALSRDQVGVASWADADLLRWSTREPRPPA